MENFPHWFLSAFTPYVIPVSLSVIAYCQRAAIAVAAAEMKYKYAVKLEDIKKENKNQEQTYSKHFSYEYDKIVTLWDDLVEWRIKYREYRVKMSGLNDTDKKFDEFRKANDVSTKLLVQLTKAAPFIDENVYSICDGILRTLENEMHNFNIPKGDINSLSTWLNEREEVLKNIEKKIFEDLIVAIRNRIGLSIVPS